MEFEDQQSREEGLERPSTFYVYFETIRKLMGYDWTKQTSGLAQVTVDSWDWHKLNVR
jgi:hypothetical protein